MPETQSPERLATADICHWFVVRTPPAGRHRKNDIRREWLNVPLPVRYPKSEVGVDDDVRIMAEDAIRALWLFNRPVAANWWVEHYKRYYNQLADEGLVFSVGVGEYLDGDQAIEAWPALAEFDAL